MQLNVNAESKNNFLKIKPHDSQFNKANNNFKSIQSKN